MVVLWQQNLEIFLPEWSWQINTNIRIFVETDETNQAGAVDAKRWLEVCRLVEVVLKALTKRMTVGPDEVRLHFRLADHSIPDIIGNTVSQTQPQRNNSHAFSPLHCIFTQNYYYSQTLLLYTTILDFCLIDTFFWSHYRFGRVPQK